METLTKPRTGSRRKVLPDKTPKEAKTNGVDTTTILAYHGMILKQEAAVAVQKKKLSKLWKLFLNEGGVRKDLELVRRFADQDPDAVLRTMKNIKGYAEALDVPIGHQMTLFEIPNGGILSEAEMADRAHRAGYFHGATGADQDLQAYPAGHDHHQRYLTGYYEGQAIWSQRIQPITIAMESEAKGKEPEPADEKEDELEEA